MDLDERGAHPRLPVVPLAAVPLSASPANPVRRRWPGILAWALVGLLVAALGGLGYLYQESNESALSWRQLADTTATELTTTRGELAQTTATLADTQAQLNSTLSSLDEARDALAETKGNLDDVAGQYNEAADRIRSLANEKAQAGDRIGFLSSVLVRSGEVSARLGECVSGQQDLQRYLVDAGSYDQDSLMAYVEQVNRDCDDAQGANDAFQAWLATQ